MTIGPLQLLLRTLFFGLVIWLAVDWALDQYETAIRERDSAITERDGLRDAARISGEMLAARDAIDLKRTEELNLASAQNAALQRDVDDGRKRLSVRATCKPAVPAPTGAAGVADAATPELAADARQDYFTLRSQLALSKQMILGLQDQIRQVCMRAPGTTATPQTDTPK
ncbi:lysis protein [Pseudomonas sp. F3-2]|uniref:lysis protein n=1 Tax=Pseudomonas sp. F3-2 TaxID=3141539 RepID=UPI00315CCDF7